MIRTATELAETVTAQLLSHSSSVKPAGTPEAVEVLESFEHRGRLVLIVRWTRAAFATPNGWDVPAVDHVYGYDVEPGSRFTYRPNTGKSAAAVRRAIVKRIDTWAADAELLPQLEKLAATSKGTMTRLATADELANLGVGDVAFVHAMGAWRQGLVTKVGRTRVEVAYTTPSSGGRVFRKSAGDLCVAA